MELLNECRVGGRRAQVDSNHYCTLVLGQSVAGHNGTVRWTLHTLRRDNVVFIERDIWPSNNPDLNPADCAIWRPCMSESHGRKFDFIDQLKKTIVLEWRALSQRFIDKSIGEWRRRLQSVVDQNGGDIEHVMRYGFTD